MRMKARMMEVRGSGERERRGDYDDKCRMGIGQLENRISGLSWGSEKGKGKKGKFGTGRWTDIFRMSMEPEPDRRGCERSRW
tara:strand:+ start:1011 stop:1256 length:246 start_codon:yes stop_codon:yes gene_type:complete